MFIVKNKIVLILSTFLFVLPKAAVFANSDASDGGKKPDCATVLSTDSQQNYSLEDRDFRSPSPLWDNAKLHFDNVLSLASKLFPQKKLIKLMQLGRLKAEINWLSAKAMRDALESESFVVEKDEKGNFILIVKITVPKLETEFYSGATTFPLPEKRQFVMRLPGLGKDAGKLQIKLKALARFKPTYDDAKDLLIFFEDGIEFEKAGQRQELVKLGRTLDAKNIAKFISDRKHMELLPEYKLLDSFKTRVAIESHLLKDLAPSFSAYEAFLEKMIPFSEQMTAQTRLLRLKFQDGDGISISVDQVTGGKKIGIGQRFFILDEKDSSTYEFWRSLKSFEVMASDFKNQVQMLKALMQWYRAEADENYRASILEGIRVIARYVPPPVGRTYETLSSAKLRSAFVNAFLKKWTESGASQEEALGYLYNMTNMNAQSNWSWTLSSVFARMQATQKNSGTFLIKDAGTSRAYLFVWMRFDDGQKIGLLKPGQGLLLDGEPVVLLSIKDKQLNDSKSFSEPWLVVEKVSKEGNLVHEEIPFLKNTKVRHDASAKELIDLKRGQAAMQYVPKDKFKLPALNSNKESKNKPN